MFAAIKVNARETPGPNTKAKAPVGTIAVANDKENGCVVHAVLSRILARGGSGLKAWLTGCPLDYPLIVFTDTFNVPPQAWLGSPVTCR
jgi:hypothetical protein